MKLLTFAIPCYNSQDYMEHCIDSILPGGEDIEILIIDDGSKDRTAEIADDYERRYPGIVRAIHQENGGHGEAVNAAKPNPKKGSTIKSQRIITPKNRDDTACADNAPSLIRTKSAIEL